MTGRHSTITVAQRDEFWRPYKAGESVLGIIGALRQRRGNIHRLEGWATEFAGFAPSLQVRRSSQASCSNADLGDCGFATPSTAQR